MTDTPLIHDPVLTAISELRPHPKNYRTHPQDQLDQLAASIRQHGFYRNVVVARDLTILAGHGIVLAAIQGGFDNVPVVILDLDADSPIALKVLAGDNFLPHLAVDDDRQLTELLRSIRDLDDLAGTGFDDLSLAALVMITRPASEIQSLDAAAEWGGMPEFGGAPDKWGLRVEFDTESQRDKFIATSGVHVTDRRSKLVWSARVENTGRADLSSLMFED